MDNPKLIIPGSAIEQIKLNEQNRILGLLMPFFTQWAALEHWVARFDQCVIDRGAGMLDQLNIIQQKVYSLYSDMEQEYKDIGLPDDQTKKTVNDRLNGYHRLVASDPAAYDILLDLTNQMQLSARLAYLSVNIQRGGQPSGMTAPRRLLAEMGIEHKGRTLHATAVKVKGVLEDWLAAHTDEHEDYRLYHEAFSLLVARKFSGQGEYMGQLMRRLKEEIGE